MGNKKRRTKAQKIKYQQGKLLKIKELEKLRIEIINTDRKIKNQKKIRTIRNLKVFRVTLKKLLIPFVFISGFTIGTGQLLNGGNPFKIDKMTNIKSIEVDYETNEELLIKENYIKYNDIIGTNPKKSDLKIYFPYTLNDSNQYEQIIRTYKLSDLDKEKLYNAILENNLKDTITNLNKYKETVKIIDEIKQTNNGYIVKCNLNLLDESDKLYVEETDENNFLVSVLESLIIALFSVIVLAVSNIDQIIIELNNKYKVVSIKDLKEELNQKRQKYLDLKKGYKL